MTVFCTICYYVLAPMRMYRYNTRQKSFIMDRASCEQSSNNTASFKGQLKRQPRINSSFHRLMYRKAYRPFPVTRTEKKIYLRCGITISIDFDSQIFFFPVPRTDMSQASATINGLKQMETKEKQENLYIFKVQKSTLF